MYDRILAVCSLIGFAIFCSVMVVYLKRIDVTIVMITGVLMAFYDFILEVRSANQKTLWKASQEQRDQI
jgi:uncharacterized RDD family membrane protein YckC